VNPCFFSLRRLWPGIPPTTSDDQRHGSVEVKYPNIFVILAEPAEVCLQHSRQPFVAYRYHMISTPSNLSNICFLAKPPPFGSIDSCPVVDICQMSTSTAHARARAENGYRVTIFYGHLVRSVRPWSINLPSASSTPSSSTLTRRWSNTQPSSIHRNSSIVLEKNHERPKDQEGQRSK
jgi:hypothetical protein